MKEIDLNVTVTDAFRKELDRLVDNVSDSEKSTLGLSLTRVNCLGEDSQNTRAFQWRVNLFGNVTQHLECSIFIVVDNHRVFIISSNQAEELRNTTLDFKGGRVVVKRVKGEGRK